MSTFGDAVDGQHLKNCIENAKAWKTVKEFIETEGDLPTSIDWISNHDLPLGTFPDR
jgi:hypothetical protein